MADSDDLELILSCRSWQEAQSVADELLKRQLVSTVEFMEIKSQSLYASAQRDIQEVKLIMRGLKANIQAVESTLSILLGHTSFVLERGESLG